MEYLDLVYPDHINVIEHPEVGTTASRIGYSPDSRFLCIPISSSETLLAVLAFYIETEEEWTQRIEAKQMVLTEMVEHYALTLVNSRLRETLRLESIHDPLTELYNRRHMEEALVREIRRARRHDTPVSILMLDIDHFKTFNDTYGHEAGDIILQELGALLQRNIRGGDIACRYGGEEFLLILPDTSLRTATQRAEEILKQIRTLTIAYQDTSLHITTSIGISALPTHGQEIQPIIHAADAALYQAKDNGRNQVVIAPIV
jgi:diguanylate cyclase (GGDEF)-like protein